MQTNDHVIRDYDVVLDREFGAPGSPERMKAEDDAYAFYLGQIIKKSRREENLTQAELAQKVGTDKAYISRVENGITIPSVSTFYRIITALGLTLSLTH